MKKTVCLIFSLFLIIGIHAQDSQYWNLQYGTRSLLLGGAVIGSVSDMAATYYNPAALALFAGPEILLSGKVYQYTALTIKQAGASGPGLTSSAIEPAPSLFAGSFTFKWLKKHKLSYSILTRQNMNFAIEGRQGAVRQGTNGQELLAGELTTQQNLSDLWSGLTWSYPLSSKLAIGISQYLSIRDQKTRYQVLAQTLDTTGNVGTSIILRQFEYKNFNLLWKAGFGINLDRLTFGLTVTTPGVHITGKGSSLVDVAVNGIDLNGNGQEDALFAADYQKDVSAQFHWPWSVGAGFSYRIGKHRVHFSAEWFDAVKKFNVLNTKDFIIQSNGQTTSNIVDNEFRSIINYGVGWEIFFKERLSGYASFITDYSAAVPGTQTNLAISFWDVYHLSAGAAFTLGRWEFTLGASYAFGKDRLERTVEFPNANVPSRIVDLLENSGLSYRRIRLLIGFSIQI